MVRIYIKKIEQLDKNEIEIIENTLSAEARERLNKKRNEELHLASLCALSLLEDEERANLAYTENGRPYFKTLDKDISIAHSRSYVAIATSGSKSTPVGIDVEDVPEAPINSSPRFLTEQEEELQKNGTPYLTVWTKKEALFKFLKNDSLVLPKIDSSAPEKHGAAFTTIQIGTSTVTVCTKKGEAVEITKKQR